MRPNEMKTSITFPDSSEEEEEYHCAARRRFDAQLPDLGWVSVEQIDKHTCCVLFDPQRNPFPIPRLVAPLHSRAFSPQNPNVLLAGQGVLVWDMRTQSWKRGIVQRDHVHGEETPVRLSSGNRAVVIANNLLTQIQPLFASPVNCQWRIHEMKGDGNCFYRAASHQIYGIAEHHAIVRKACGDFIELERAYFEPFIKGGFEHYVDTIRKQGSWGDDPELQALSEIYHCNVEVYTSYDFSIIKQIQYNDSSQQQRVIRLVFHEAGHYDSITNQQDAQQQRPLVVAVGQMEAKAIEHSKSRRAGGIAAGTQQSDLHETERIQLEEAETLTALRDTEANNTEQQLVDKALQDSLDEFMLMQALEDSLYM